jgi:hypothetical protein
LGSLILYQIGLNNTNFIKHDILLNQKQYLILIHRLHKYSIPPISNNEYNEKTGTIIYPGLRRGFVDILKVWDNILEHKLEWRKPDVVLLPDKKNVL